MRRNLIRLVLACSAVGLVGVAGALSPRPLGAQQSGGLPALERRVAALEAGLTAKSQQIDALQAALDAERAARQAADTALTVRIEAIERKTHYMSVSGTETYFVGTNVHIRNGLEATNGVPGDIYATRVNGLGNLLIGYNRPRGAGQVDERTGSHNLVMGDANNFKAYGGIVSGENNAIERQYSTVIGGYVNTASGPLATILGGSFNTADGVYATVSGGSFNLAAGDNSAVSGGTRNRAEGGNSAVGGGLSRVAPLIQSWAAGSLFEVD